MKRVLIFVFVLISFYMFSQKIALVENNDIIFSEVHINEVTVEALFNILSSYENSFVPKNILIAYYFVDTALIFFILLRLCFY